jgi:phosphoenolpyruvate carboxykinase (ATP)
VQAYLINTGGVGEISEKLPDGRRRIHRAVTRISLDETPAVFRAIVRNQIEWEQEPYFGTLVPERVEGMDISKFAPANFYSQGEIDKYAADLNAERRKHIEQYPGLNPAIVKALR